MAGRPGKYATITPRLPKYVDPDKKRVDKVTAVAESVEHDAIGRGVAINAAHVAACYEDLRKEKEALDEKQYSLQLELDAFTMLILKYYEAEGVSSMTLQGGGVVRVQQEPSPSVIDPVAFRQWCLDHGYADQMKLNPSTAAALVKERLVNGETVPDGVEVSAYSKIVYTK